MTQLSDRTLIIGLVILQIAVCLPFINSFPVALDEPFSIFWAQQDLGLMISEINKGNNSPLHFVVLSGWIELFGISPISVRSLSLLFSLGTVICIYVLSRKFLSQSFSSFAVLLFVFSKFDHFHSMEARMYALFLLLFALSLLSSYELIFEKKNRIIVLTIVNVGLLYTHYLAVIVIASQALMFIANWSHLDKKVVQYYLATLILTGLCFLPGLLVLVDRFLQQSESATWVPEPHPTELYGNIIRFCNGTLTFVIFVLSILVLAFFKYRSQAKKFFAELNKPPLRFILLAFLAPYLGMYLYSIILSPIFLDRYLLFTTIPLFIFIAILLSKVAVIKREWSTVALLSMIMAGGVNFIPDNNRVPNEVASFVHEELRSDGKILIVPPYYDLTFIYHFDPRLFSSDSMLDRANSIKKIQAIYNFDEVKDSSSYSQLILVDDHFDDSYPGNNVRTKLSEWGRLESEKDFTGGTKVMVFTK